MLAGGFCNDVRRHGRTIHVLHSVVRTSALALALCACFAASALAETATYSATETIPVPPASNYAGSGGGDGWAVALSPTQVFNVFHHNPSLTVACHLQSDASPCWSSATETITDTNGNGFSTSGQPGLYLDQNTGKLYVYATRTSDSTGGVVCIDTTQGGNTSDPFCGFTALTQPGEAPTNGGGYSGLTAPMLVGSHWYSFNYVGGVAVNVADAAPTGARDELLCFDVQTDAACSHQPFSMNIGAGNVGAHSPSPAGAAIGSQLIVPLTINGSDELACFDDSGQGNCSGSWPASAPSGFVGSNGAPFPMLDGTSAITGVCLPNGTDTCYTLGGAVAPTPAGMTGAIGGGSVSWNGPGLVLGPRVYVPAWGNTVYCYDAATQASCSGFPKQFANLGLLYTVNPDPQRPTCIWVNSDNGSSQIQNFDAYTGGACGQGAIRVLASRFIVPRQACFPDSYQSLQVVSPGRGSYSDGSVQFDNNDGNQIAGIADQALDGTGSVNLNGLNLNSATGLPQFLITLNGTQGAPGQVVVKLTWTAAYDPSCVAPTAENVSISTPPSTTPSTTPATLWTLTVRPDGTGSGTVTDSAKAISCKPNCSHKYTAGTVVTLTAHPASGSTFAGWQGGGCSGKGACKVTMNASRTVTALFNRLPREAPRLRFGSEQNHGNGTPFTGITAAPEQPGCSSELAFIADVGCSSTKLTISGSISKQATGRVAVIVYAWFGTRRGTGRISAGHWVVHLSVPGINQDPLAPKYLVIVRYGGNRAVKPGSKGRRVRIEVERPDLGGA
jgi:Divergent InlB B-repeat domain